MAPRTLFNHINWSSLLIEISSRRRTFVVITCEDIVYQNCFSDTKWCKVIKGILFAKILHQLLLHITLKVKYFVDFMWACSKISHLIIWLYYWWTLHALRQVLENYGKNWIVLLLQLNPSKAPFHANSQKILTQTAFLSILTQNVEYMI